METFAFFVLITMAKLQTALCSTSTGCVDSCVARFNGNYQHCSDCHYYVACSNGYKYVMPCPSNLVWDDVRKRCEWTSLTCNARMYSGIIVSPRHGCVNSCVGLHDGNYEHCSDCHRYVTCSNWYEYIMPCPSNLVWDDIKKRCEWMSLTCRIKTPESRKTPFNPSSVYSPCRVQHCSDCHHYVTCSNQYKYIMPCSSNILWDDVCGKGVNG